MANPIFVNERPIRSISEFEFVHDPNDKNSKLGVGSFASVKLAKDKKTGKSHAVKIISMHPSKVTSSDLHNIRTEITIHRKLDHPNIIKFHDYLQKEHNVYLVLDYAENGNLYSFLHKKKKLSSEEIFRFFHQTTLAIQYLHQNDILHRDIKPENLLLDSSHNIKLCDFGWSTRRITEKRLTFCGTYEYMAPEIVHKKPYDYRVDVWSLGVLLYELIHREAPYKGRSLPEITKSLAKTQITFSSSCNPDAKDLILKILKNNPSERLSINQILSHTWVRQNLFKDGVGSIQTDFLVSPRDIKSAHLNSVYGESPKMNPRRDKENFKSEILSSTDHIIFSEFTSPQTKRSQNHHLFSSFNASSTIKDQDTERVNKEKTRDLNSILTPDSINMSQSDISKRKPLQEFGSNLQLKTISENMLTARGHTKSSSSLTHNVLEKLVLDERKTPTNLSKKKKIFENNLLSPAFRTKVNSIIQNLSSQTTTHKTAVDISAIFADKLLNQHSTRAYTGVPTITNRYQNDHPLTSLQNTQNQAIIRNKSDLKNDENCQFGTSSSNSNVSKARAESEALKRAHTPTNVKTNIQVKLSLPKGDNIPAFASPLSNANRTARSKIEARSPEPLESRINLMTYSQKFGEGELVRPMTSKNSENGTSASKKINGKSKERQDFGFAFNNFYKSLDYKKKTGMKFIDEVTNQHIVNLQDRRNERKEQTKREYNKDKENHMVMKDTQQLRNWAF